MRIPNNATLSVPRNDVGGWDKRNSHGAGGEGRIVLQEMEIESMTKQQTEM
jgi:hypothetical protein